MAQPVITDGSVVALHVGILLRFSGLDVVDLNALFLRPRDELVTDVLRAIVPTERL